MIIFIVSCFFCSTLFSSTDEEMRDTERQRRAKICDEIIARAKIQYPESYSMQLYTVKREFECMIEMEKMQGRL